MKGGCCLKSYNYSDIKKIADDLCSQWGINEYPVKIVDLCANLGLAVFERYLPETVSGFIVVQNDNFNDFDTNRLIVVNKYNSARRKRFTAAHELAHYILHKGNDPLYAHRDAGQRDHREVEADIFASNILMPEFLVREALLCLREDQWGTLDADRKISYIADEFAVSRDAAYVRMNKLRLI